MRRFSFVFSAAALLHYLPFILLTVWVMYFGVSYENTLELAAENKIDFFTAWAYRFRTAAFDAATHAGFLLTPWLWIVKLIGARAFWAGLILVQAALSRRAAIATRLTFLALCTAGAMLGEAIIAWSLVLLLVTRGLRGLRQTRLRGVVALLAAACFTAFALLWANPRDYATRQAVLGGKSFIDNFRTSIGLKLVMRESCVVAMNPDDLRGLSAVERFSRDSLKHFAEIKIVDLKVVEDNYRLLFLKDEKGKNIFSDAARAFAAAENSYAQKIIPDLVKAPKLCLVAHFSVQPAREEKPYSRARKIVDLRKTAGLDTRLIQLPAER